MVKNLPGSIKEVDTDVLVIGGGIVAAAAALEAVKHGVGITLVDKSRFGVSGSSACSGGAVNVYFPPELGGDPEDSKEQLFKDIVERGFYLNDQKMVEILVEEATSEIIFLDEIGIPFLKRPNGQFLLGSSWSVSNESSSKSKGQYAEQKRSLSIIGKPYEKGGPLLMRLLRKEVFHRGVQVLENVMITRLLTNDGSIVGAVGINTLNGDYCIFKAKAIVLGAGSATKLSANTGEPYVTTGDGYALAYEAGGIFSNMEFIDLKSNAKPKGIDLSQGIGHLGPMLSHITMYNALGEKFLEKYAASKEGGDFRGVLSSSNIGAILKELKAGRGPIYGDATHFSQELWDRNDCRRDYNLLKAMGYDAKKERFEFQAPESHDYLGGLKINEKAMSNIPGLYAAGEAAGHGGVFGASRIAGLAIPACMAFGRRAGKYAAERTRVNHEAMIKKAEVKKEIDRLEKLKGGKGRKPHELENEVRSFGSKLCAIRDEPTLQKTIQAFVRIRKDDTLNAAISNIRDLIKTLEVQNLALSGEMVARAALMRTETRGYHFREEFPHRDDKNWLKWVIIQKEGGRMKLRAEPVPLQRYRIKPKSEIKKR